MTIVSMICPPSRLHARQRVLAAGARGFTLLEILVALGLGMLILLALTILFSRNSGNQSELERTVRQVESARFSLDALAEDVMHAGYFGEFDPDALVAPPPLAGYTEPDPCAIDPALQGWDTQVVPILMPAPVQGIAAGTVVTCLNDRRPNTEAIVVRRADTGPAITLAQGKDTNLYIQITRCTTQIAPQPIRAAIVPSATLNLMLPDCATVNDSLRRLTQRTYYIATCNDCAAGDGIPTLKRVEMINGALRTVSVAEGVENLQVEYGLDTNDDGSPDNFVAEGAIKLGVFPNQWRNVVSLRLHLLTRSTQTTPGYSDVRTYQVGAVAVTPTDGFKRTLMTTTVRLQNVGGRRE